MPSLPVRLLVLVLLLAAPPLAAQEIHLAAGEPLSMTHLQELLAGAVPGNVDGRRVGVDLVSPRLPMSNTSTRAVTVRLSDLRVEADGRRFDGTLEVQVAGAVTGSVHVSGALRNLVQVPMPAQPIAGGQLLAPSDLVLGWVPEDQLRDGMLLASAEVAGLEAGRRLMAGRPIMTADLRASRLVRKGEVVQLVYRRDRLELVTQGRALEDASQGEPVRVANLDSERPVRGIVTDRRRVLVSPEVEAETKTRGS